VIHVMTGKLGRKPTKDELRAALATLQVPP
jgi:hypothetical protein